ncbi:germin-like protein subfamily 1 member 17 [Nicotiana attenuata]|uniref:Germin-like protein n=1 Tax=Nicotiana attenuata TaxID=49451 RepID=A0A314KM91_NICAT|nr:germin-like protein subfamily 1 member 17 [Nicotiana attenuata]
MCWLMTTLAIAALFSSQLAYAYDLDPLQDICVAVNDSKASVFVNRKICKDPNLAKADDFFASCRNVIGNIVQPKYGFAVNVVDVNRIPGLNTLDVFKSRLFSKILNPGDVFVIPQGLIHFLYNVGHKNATLLASFNSQNPGFVMIPSEIFASDPPILDDVLAKGFQLDKKVIKQLRKKFS